MSAKVKIGIGALLGLAVGLTGGYGAGRLSTGTPANPFGGGTYQQGYDAAKKKIEDAHVFPPAPTEARSLNGTLKAKSGSTLTFEAVIPSPNPLDEINAPAERTVTVDKNTKIYRQESVDPAELQKELQDFQQAQQKGQTGATPPQPFKQVPLTIDDLKVGDNLTVTADHNILYEKAFTAVEIILNPSGAPGAGLPPLAPPPAR